MLVHVLNGLGGQNDAPPAQSASVVQAAPQGESLGSGSVVGLPPSPPLGGGAGAGLHTVSSKI